MRRINCSAAVAENPDHSMNELARSCGWLWQNGEPAKSKVERVLKRLKAEKLVKYSRGRWVLTPDGKKARGKGSNVDAGSDAFRLSKGKRVRGTECVHCGNAYGEVFKIRNGRVKKGKGRSACTRPCAGSDGSVVIPKKGAGRLKRDFFGNRPIFAKQDRTAGQLGSEQTRNPCFTGRPTRTAFAHAPQSFGGAWGVAKAVPSWLTPYKETIRTLQRQGVTYGARRIAASRKLAEAR